MCTYTAKHPSQDCLSAIHSFITKRENEWNKRETLHKSRVKMNENGKFMRLHACIISNEMDGMRVDIAHGYCWYIVIVSCSIKTGTPASVVPMNADKIKLPHIPVSQVRAIHCSSLSLCGTLQFLFNFLLFWRILLFETCIDHLKQITQKLHRQYSRTSYKISQLLFYSTQASIYHATENETNRHWMENINFWLLTDFWARHASLL